MWTPVTLGTYPFEHVRPKETIVIDLVRGILLPDREGDDVEKYYKAISRWFHEVLEKERIPMAVIETAILTITPDLRKCEIKAQGRIFSAERSF